MSKVLIDRELLERVQERLDPHRDAVLWGDVCDTFRSAPSGTPAMPVKAYYHEWTDLEGVRTRSVGLEVRKAFIDAPLVLESDALARIACLEGEIAKRDEELAACRVAVENCEVFRARIAELEARIVWLECEAQVNAAPVSEAKAQGEYGDAYQGAREDLAIWKRRALEAEKALQEERIITERLCDALNEENGPTFMGEPVFPAKAQGVVMPEKIQQALDFSRNFADSKPDIGITERQHILGLANLLEKVASLNAAPVQQVSVPASAFASRAITHYEAALLAAFPSGSSGEVFNQWNEARRVLAAAPAAPAADAPPENCRQRLAAEGKPYPRSSCAACGQFSPKWRECDAALAAHRAKGVV